MYEISEMSLEQAIFGFITSGPKIEAKRSPGDGMPLGPAEIGPSLMVSMQDRLSLQNSW